MQFHLVLPTIISITTCYRPNYSLYLSNCQLWNKERGEIILSAPFIMVVGVEEYAYYSSPCD